MRRYRYNEAVGASLLLHIFFSGDSPVRTKKHRNTFGDRKNAGGE